MSSTCTSPVESKNLTQETCTETNSIISQNDSISENKICTIATIKTEAIESFNESASESVSKEDADTPSDHDCPVSQITNEENVKCENNIFGLPNHRFKESKIILLLDLSSSIQKKRDLYDILRVNLDKEVFDSACAVFMQVLRGGFKKGTIVFDTVEHACKAFHQLDSIKNPPYKHVRMVKDRANYIDDDFSIYGNAELDDITSEGSQKNVSKSPSSRTIFENYTDDNIEHVLVLKHVDPAVSDTCLREYINKHLNEEAFESMISFAPRTAGRLHAKIAFRTKKGAISAKHLLETAENPPFESVIAYQDRLDDRKRELPRDGDSPVPKRIKKSESKVLFLSNVPRGWSKADIMDFLKSLGLYDLQNMVKYVFKEYITGTKNFSGRCHILFANSKLATVACQKIKAAKGPFNGSSANVKFEFPDSDYAIPWLPNGLPDLKAIKLKKNREIHNMLNKHGIKLNTRPAISQQIADFQQDGMEGTFELSQHFLESKDLPTPLVSKIIVEHLPTRMKDEEKIKQMFSIAGKVEAVHFTYKSDDKFDAHVEFDHPLEAVQAISMFNEQKVYDKKIYVTMETSTDAAQPVYPSGMEQLGPGLCTNGNVMKNIRQSVELQSAVKKINDKIESMQNSVESLRHSIEELQKSVQKQNVESKKTEANTATSAESTNQLATLLTSLTNTSSSANPGLLSVLSNLNPQALQLLQQQNQTSNQPQTPGGDLNSSQSQVNWGSNQIDSQSTQPGSAQATNLQGSTSLLTSNREKEPYTNNNPQNPNLQWPNWQNAQGALNWQNTQEPPNWATAQNGQWWPNNSPIQFEHPAQVVQNVLAGWFAHCMQNGQDITTGQYGQGSQLMATGQYTQGGPTAVARQYAQDGPPATGRFAQGGPMAVTGQIAQSGPTVTNQYSNNCPPMATVQYPLASQMSVSGQYPPTGQYSTGTSTGQYPTGTSTGQYPTGTSTEQNPTGTSTGQYPTGTSTGQLPQSQPKGQIGSNLNTDKNVQGSSNSANGGNSSQSSLNASTKKIIIGGHKSLSKVPDKNSHNTNKTGNIKKIHDPYTLQFSNLPPSVTLTSLDSKMREVGPLRSTEMTGPGRAVVTFCSAQDARTCIKLLDDTKVDNQRIRVMYLSDV